MPPERSPLRRARRSTPTRGVHAQITRASGKEAAAADEALLLTAADGRLAEATAIRERRPVGITDSLVVDAMH